MVFHRQPHTYVGKVHLKVTNLEQSLTFYQQVMGFQVLEKSAEKASLTADGATVLLTIEQPPGVSPKQPRTTGLYHFALLLPARSDLADMLYHLLQTAYPLQGASDHLVSEAIYLADPDGNGIEIYRDRPADSWNWKNGEVMMATEALDAENLLAERGERIWEGLPAATQMGHIHLHVAELEKTKAFYVDGLGFDIVNSQYGSQVLFISTGFYHHHIGLNIWNGKGAPAPSENNAGLDYFSLMLSSDQKRKEVVANLEAIGAAVWQEEGNLMTKDPSGNRLKLEV